MNCMACDAPIVGKNVQAWYCAACAHLVKLFRRKILRNIAHAQQFRGFPRPAGKCVDCKQYDAKFYEHRDYFKPWDVQPVCGGCNRSRGPAHPFNGEVAHFHV